MKRTWRILMLMALCLTALVISCAQAEEAQIEGAQIYGKVWVEKEIDGLMQEKENALAQAVIVLEQKTADGAVISLAEQKSGKDGQYAFSVSQPGEYRLRIELPYQYQFTIHGGDSAALPAQKRDSYTPFFSLENGQIMEANIGSTRTTCYISIYAFEDVNTNGGRMQTEPKIRNVLAELIYEYEGESYVIASVTTNKEGEASIQDLSPGSYKLRVTLPDHFMIGPLGLKVNAFYNCVLASDDQVGYTDTFTISPKGSQGLGVGAVRTGSLEGAVWYDQNANGLKEENESSLNGVGIRLHSDALNLTRETSPDENGNYAFRHIQPGDYQLTVTLPEGMIFTRPGHSLINQIAREYTVSLSVQADNTHSLGYIGAMDASSLSLFVYDDDPNANGKYDAGEAFFPGAEITLWQDGQLVAQGISNTEVPLRFSTLRTGDVTIKASLPDGRLLAASTIDLIQINQPVSQGEATIYVPSPLENTEESLYSIGTVSAASASGLLFEDPWNVGAYQSDFAHLPGFTVQAVNADGQVQAQSVTDAQGCYQLYPLLPGDYTLRFLLNDPYVAAPFNTDHAANNAILSQTPEYGETGIFHLDPGQRKESVNAGIFRAGVVDGYVLLNANHDNLLTSEGGMENVLVTLLDEYGAPFSEFSYSVTDENGYYYIKGVLPGTYSLLYTMPDNGAFTTPVTESREMESSPFTSESGSEIRMQDVGAVRTSTLSGSVLHEGMYPVQAHVMLTSHTFGTVYETETWDDGQYIITGLRPDTYDFAVNLTDEAGYVFRNGEDSPIAATPASQASVTLSFAMGQDMMNANIYAALPASIHGLIYYDGNINQVMDGIDCGAEERYFSLCREGILIADLVTDGEGRFDMDQLVPGAYTIQMYLEDNEILVGQPAPVSALWEYAFTVEDGAWQQPVELPMLRYSSVSGQFWSLDGTENGISNIAIDLTDMNGNPIASAISDSEGSYSFEGLLPGEYTLYAHLPTGYLFAREKDLADQSSMIYSLTDGSFSAMIIPVAIGEDLSGQDVGIGAMGGIGDYAWLDENGNGMQDIGESPIPGIQIALYQHGQLIASTETDAYGFWHLSGLYPGEYDLEVTMHKELKATHHQEQFPLVASILPEGNETTLTAEGIIVPSGGRTLHYDLGFQLRKKNVYPKAMDLIPKKDWRPYVERESE